MSELPGVTKPPWYTSEILVELLSSIVTIAALLYEGSRDPAKRYLLAIAVIAMIAFAVKMAKAYRSDKEKRREHSPEDLAGPLEVIQQVVLAAAGRAENDIKLRATVWRVVPPGKGHPEPSELQQILQYVGAPGGPVGRRHSIHAGCIGDAVRHKEPSTMHRVAEEEKAFRNELMKVYGYTKGQAKEIDSDRWSAVAVPIFGPGEGERVIGVVYMDCQARQFFTEEIQRLVIAGAVGLARYNSRRYGSSKSAT